MNGELFGLGRTWWGFLLIVGIVTVMLGLGKMEAGVWQEVVTWTFAIAGGKSAIVGGAEKLKIGGKQ